MPGLEDILTELIAEHSLEDIALAMMDYCEAKAKVLEAIGLLKLAHTWQNAAQTMELATDNISWAEYEERQGEQQGYCY